MYYLIADYINPYVMFQANVAENLEKESEANDHVTVGSGRWIRYMKSDNDSSKGTLQLFVGLLTKLSLQLGLDQGVAISLKN